MSVKFSVGVSETDEDRALLEALRQSPNQIDRPSDPGPEPRPAGWPVSSDAEDDAEGRPSWAW